MRAAAGGGSFHMVCPRLLELDSRHGEHLAGHKYPLPEDERHKHTSTCGCLYDPEGHRVATLVMPPGSEIADDHPHLTCRCGRQLVVGERI